MRVYSHDYQQFSMQIPVSAQLMFPKVFSCSKGLDYVKSIDGLLAFVA